MKFHLYPTLTLILLAPLCLNGGEQVTIQTLSVAEEQQLEKARQDVDEAQAAKAKADATYQMSENRLAGLEHEIRQRFGDNSLESCSLADEGTSKPITSVEIRGRYAVITQTQYLCKTLVQWNSVEGTLSGSPDVFFTGH